MGIGRVALNLNLVRERVAKRCAHNGVDPGGILIVGITKTFSPEVASEAVRAGLNDLGENKVQEAALKIPMVKPRPRWHLVGHLQRNKVNKATEIFDVIQSVDSLEVAESISRRAAGAGRTMEIYLQVNSSYEPQKSGFDPGEIYEIVDNLSNLPNLQISGLMTIGPLTDDVKMVEKSFSLAKALFDRLRQNLGPGFNRLSMGMSGDFELALDHGANVLRLGTAIFGAR